MRIRITGPLAALATLAFPAASPAPELPRDETQVTLNSYADNFGVIIVYPALSGSRRIGESTSLSGRYLVDAISAASIRMRFDVDGVTSATSSAGGGGDDGIDELRQEAGLGVTRLLGDATLTMNGLYSTEHDYRSGTLAGSLSRPFVRRNTELSLGFVRSWDRVSPQTRFWTKDKDVATVTADVTQTLTPWAIAQVELFYSQASGFLSDAYQVVTILDDADLTVTGYEPRHPGERSRRAVGVRTSTKTSSTTSLQVGYRRYWDSWDVSSHTADVLLQKNLRDEKMTVGVRGRAYEQSRAYFFRPEYAAPERYMTVDSKLDSGRSQEIQLRLRVNSSLLPDVPGLGSEDVDLDVRLGYYHRRTSTEHWNSRRRDLHAYVTSVGMRYRF